MRLGDPWDPWRFLGRRLDGSERWFMRDDQVDMVPRTPREAGPPFGMTNALAWVVAELDGDPELGEGTHPDEAPGGAACRWPVLVGGIVVGELWSIFTWKIVDQPGALPARLAAKVPGGDLQ